MIPDTVPWSAHHRGVARKLPGRAPSHDRRINALLAGLVCASAGLSLSIVLNLASPQTPRLQVQPAGEGIHWHASLNIVINGQDIPLPAGVGLSEDFTAVQHTHEWDDIIHIEGPPAPENLRLGTLFDIWGVRFTDSCLFQYCSTPVQMTVNGEPSQEYESYQMQDGDEIVLLLETEG